MERLIDFKNKNFDEIDMVMPIVERVHGPHHEEIYEVAKLYEAIKDKLNSGDKDLDLEFSKLRDLTDNYSVPSDVCETYEKIYKQLEELDALYQAR